VYLLSPYIEADFIFQRFGEDGRAGLRCCISARRHGESGVGCEGRVRIRPMKRNPKKIKMAEEKIKALFLFPPKRQIPVLRLRP